MTRNEPAILAIAGRFALAAAAALAFLMAGAGRSRGQTPPETAAAPTTSPAPATAPTTARAPVGARLGVIRFSPPPRWQAEADPGGRAIVYADPDAPPDRPTAIAVVLLEERDKDFDFRARFEKAVASAAGGRPLTERGPVEAGAGPQGSDTLAQTFAFVSPSDKRVRGRLVAERVGDHVAAICYLAGDDAYRQRLPELDNLLASVHFDLPPSTAPATVPTTLASAGPATAPAGDARAIEKEEADLRHRLAELEARRNASESKLPPPTTLPATRPQPAAPAADAGALSLIDRSADGGWLRTRYPKGTRVIVTLTPIAGAAARGTAAEGPAGVRTLSCDAAALTEPTRFPWLPPTTFKVSARAVTPDGKEWPLKLTTSAAPRLADWADSIDANLQSAPTLGVTDAPRGP